MHPRPSTRVALFASMTAAVLSFGLPTLAHAQTQGDDAEAPISKPADAQRVAELEAQIEQMTAQWQDTLDDMTAQHASLTDRLAAMTRDQVQLEESLVGLDRTHTGLVQIHNALTTEHEELTVAHSDLETAHTHLENQLAESSQTNRRLASTLETALMQNETLTEAQADLDEQNGQLTAQLEATRENLADLRINLERTTQALTDARQSNVALQQNMQNLNQQLAAANARIAEFEADERARNAVAFEVTGNVTRLNVNADRQTVLTVAINGPREFEVGERLSIAREGGAVYLGTYRVTASQQGRLMAVCLDENLRPAVGDDLVLSTAQD